mmetsp:Transcript_48533/g.103863  ORF Transcript_48533/g.103863 Transcript_48533/m.103863 type:complete len:215 (-) Transcript_48533:24-668(-)
MEALLCDHLTFTGVPAEGAMEGDELLPGGRDRRVTEENKVEYLDLLVEHRLVGDIRQELAYLCEGFHDLMPRSVLRAEGTRSGERDLAAVDLELLIGGLPTLDLDEWQKHCVDEVVEANPQLSAWFWEVLRRYGPVDQAKVLSFACGSGRVPISGFAGMSPPFRISLLGFQTPDNLPTAHTCFNQLCLPPYDTQEQLHKKLSTAIHAGGGFYVV